MTNTTSMTAAGKRRIATPARPVAGHQDAKGRVVLALGTDADHYGSVRCVAADRHLAFAWDAGGCALIAELEGVEARTRRPVR